jgi:hypothetical protein
MFWRKFSSWGLSAWRRQGRRSHLIFHRLRHRTKNNLSIDLARRCTFVGHLCHSTLSCIMRREQWAASQLCGIEEGQWVLATKSRQRKSLKKLRS